MLQDPQKRVLSYLRISVTERCNFRCVYCMPEAGVTLSPRENLLSFEEIARVATVGAQLGLTKIRLTGGEPTVRRDLPKLVKMLRAIPQIREIAMTTNAARLRVLAKPLLDAGLNRVNISLDTLQRERMKTLSRRDLFDDVMRGIEAAHENGLSPKFNAVVMRGINDDELPDLVDFAHKFGAQMRFIEWMPMGAARFDSANRQITSVEMLAILSTRFEFVRESESENFAFANGKSAPGNSMDSSAASEEMTNVSTNSSRENGNSTTKITARVSVNDELANAKNVSARDKSTDESTANFANSAATREISDPARGWICRKSGARVAFISSMSDDFCATCNRMRLTAEGGLRPCLHQDAEVDVRQILRRNGSDFELENAFREAANLKWAGHKMTASIPLYSAKDMVLIGG